MRRTTAAGSRLPESARAAIRSCSVAVAGVVFSANAIADCSRDMLEDLADTYVDAQKAGNAAALPLAAGAYYGENDVEMDIGDGVLSESMTVDFTRSYHDTTLCATFTELVAATHPHPYVIHTRIEATEDGAVSKMESVVTDEGDWVFGAEPYLNFTMAEDWSEIPAGQRDTRAAIQAAADAYIDNWGDPDLPVPHGTPCARLEGRIYTGTRDPEGQTCTMGAFPRPLDTGNRRYVIDETVGAVTIFHDFPFIDAGLPEDHPGTPASQMFRVEGGMNRYIHEVTACTTADCGRGGARQGGPGGGRGAAPGGRGGPGGPGGRGPAPGGG